MIRAFYHKLWLFIKLARNHVTAGAWRDYIVASDNSLSLLSVENYCWGTSLPLKALWLVALGTWTLFARHKATYFLFLPYRSSWHLLEAVIGIVIWRTWNHFALSVIFLRYVVMRPIVSGGIYPIVGGTRRLNSCLTLTDQNSLCVAKSCRGIFTKDNCWLWSIMRWSWWLSSLLLFHFTFPIKPCCREYKLRNNRLSLQIFSCFDGFIILWSWN